MTIVGMTSADIAGIAAVAASASFAVVSVVAGAVSYARLRRSRRARASDVTEGRSVGSRVDASNGMHSDTPPLARGASEGMHPGDSGETGAVASTEHGLELAAGWSKVSLDGTTFAYELSEQQQSALDKAWEMVCVDLQTVVGIQHFYAAGEEGAEEGAQVAYYFVGGDGVFMVEWECATERTTKANEGTEEMDDAARPSAG